MRLWHETLIPILPRQQLLGQHRECCALRGNGWQKKHATVQYIFNSSLYRLFLYHKLVMDEMKRRGYYVNPLWKNPAYRGSKCLALSHNQLEQMIACEKPTQPIYLEHDDDYLQGCINNLMEKGIYLEINQPNSIINR